MTNFKDHFSNLSINYQKYRPTYPDELFDYLRSICQSNKYVWDVGTGNGQAALKLATRFDHILATDPSINQIKSAPENSKIDYHVSSAENCPAEPNSFDLITVAQAFHWFNFEAFFQEVNRVAKPKSKLAIWTYTLAIINPEIDQVIKYFYEEIVGEYWPKERAHIETLYDDISIPFELIPAFKFNIELNYNMEDMLQYLGTWSAVKYYKNENKIDPVELIRLELTEAWKDSSMERKVKWPIHLKIYKIK